MNTLQLIAEGFSTKEIAAKLDLSFNTVAVHRANLMDRLDIHDLARLVRYAIESGIAWREEKRKYLLTPFFSQWYVSEKQRFKEVSWPAKFRMAGMIFRFLSSKG